VARIAPPRPDPVRRLPLHQYNWVCPRYSFSNKSPDIKGIFCDACERIGVHWTAAGETTIYGSRKADVALLDTFIGPKR
jgi:hypothetical protein